MHELTNPGLRRGCGSVKEFVKLLKQHGQVEMINEFWSQICPGCGERNLKGMYGDDGRKWALKALRCGIWWSLQSSVTGLSQTMSDNMLQSL